MLTNEPALKVIGASTGLRFQVHAVSRDFSRPRLARHEPRTFTHPVQATRRRDNQSAFFPCVHDRPSTCLTITACSVAFLLLHVTLVVLTRGFFVATFLIWLEDPKSRSRKLSRTCFASG